MGMDPISMGLISSGVGALGSIIGGWGAANAQSAAEQQAQAQGQEASQLLGQGISTDQNAANSWQSAMAPVISYATSLLNGSNPNLRTLENWNGLTPQELSALSANAAASGLSDINTARSQGAYGANQNAVIQNALRQNRQGADNAMVNVGAAASQQELQAREEAAQLQGAGAGVLESASNNPYIGMLSQLLGTGAGDFLGASQNSTKAAASIGNPYQGMLSSLSQYLPGLLSTGSTGSTVPSGGYVNNTSPTLGGTTGNITSPGVTAYPTTPTGIGNSSSPYQGYPTLGGLVSDSNSNVNNWGSNSPPPSANQFLYGNDKS